MGNGCAQRVKDLEKLFTTQSHQLDQEIDNVLNNLWNMALHIERTQEGEYYFANKEAEINEAHATLTKAFGGIGE